MLQEDWELSFPFSWIFDVLSYFHLFQINLIRLFLNISYDAQLAYENVIGAFLCISAKILERKNYEVNRLQKNILSFVSYE